MKRSRIIYQPSSKPTARIILLHFIVFAVSVRVTSICIEEVCADPTSIKTVIPQSGECFSCFPCPPCVEGQTPSVHCGSTVPRGTEIHCVPIRPDPVTSTTAVTFTPLATSPSVTSGHSSLTEPKQFTVGVSVSSHIHPMVVAATSSKHYAGVGSSVVHPVLKGPEKPRKKRESPQDKHQKQQGSNTFIYKFCAFFLIFTIVAIYYRCRKGQDKRLHLPSTVANRSPTREPFSSDWSEQGSDICSVDPETGTAVYSRFSHKDCEEPKKGKNNQGDVDAPEETAAAIPSDVPFAEGGQSDEDHLQDSDLDEGLLLDLSPVASPINPQYPSDQSTNVFQALGSGPSIVTPSVKILVQAPSGFKSQNQLVPQCLGIWNGNAGELDQGRCVNWPALSQSDRYKTKIVQVPFPLLNTICLSLDVKRKDGKDVRLFAHELGYVVPREFDPLEQAANRDHASTTYVILKERFLTKKPSATVGDFVEIMKAIGRDDIIDLINE